MTWSGKKEDQIKLVNIVQRRRGEPKTDIFSINKASQVDVFREKQQNLCLHFDDTRTKNQKSNLFPLGEPRGLKVHLGAMVKELLY